MPDFFCPLPWIHQFAQSTGIKCCCANTVELPVDSASFASSQFIKDLRNEILNGNVPESCRECVRQEKAGFVSTRTTALKEWAYTKDNIPTELKYLDLRTNNTCNFKCRSCMPLYSTQIQKELSQNIELSRYFKNVGESVKHSFDLSNIEVLNLTGGEPLIIKEHISILEELIKLGKQATKILITTNGSTLNPRLLNLLSQFTDIHYTISLDSIGTAAEYIRDGTKWAQVDNNVRQFCGTNSSILINCTVSTYSILTIGNLVEYFVQLKKDFPTTPLEIMFSVVQTPSYLVPQALPSHLLPVALTSLDKSIELLTPIKTNPIEHLNTLSQLQNSVRSTALHAQKTFVEFTKTLDRIRGQNFSTTFGVPLTK